MLDLRHNNYSITLDSQYLKETNSHFLALSTIEWMMQLGNQMGSGVPHNKGGLPSWMHKSKQPKSISAILQQKYNWNQVKVIP